MQDWIIRTMENLGSFGYLGIFLLITLENIFPPIPSEIILTFGGFLTTQSELTFWGVIIAATIGSVIGAVLLYGIGRLLSADRLAKILDSKIGKILHFKKEDVYKSCDWFNKRGKKSVLICRCIPIVRSLISIPAGMAKMEIGIFIILTTTGSFIWNTVLVYLGVKAGESYLKIVDGVGIYQTITLIVLGILGLLAVIWYIRFRKNNKSAMDK
ncbi:MAG: DedA family protein [Herbinix sp.]|nr:DedA family protein [Herbinix sp.]